MKKYLLFLACASVAFAACDPEQNSGVPGLDELPEIGAGDKPTQELAPGEQQAKLESVGDKLLTEFPAESFENLATIAEAFDKTYGGNEDYDLSELETWMENVEDISYSYKSEDKPLENGTHYISRINLMILLSNHTGLFTFGANKVTVAPYDGVKAVFNAEGKTYEVELTSSGEVTQAYFKYEWHSTNKRTDGSGNDYTYESKYDDECAITVGVPENISLAISENGTPLATVDVKFTLNITPEHFQLATDAFAVEASVMINGYELKMSRTGYDGPASKAQMMTTLSAQGETLVTATASADLRLKNELVEYERNDNYGSYYYHKGIEVVVEKFENFRVAVDVLGEIQIVGTCSDVVNLNDEVDAVYQALSDYDWETGESKPVDEATAAKHTKNVNDMVDFAVYYDNGSNRQADIEFEHYYEKQVGNQYELISLGLYPVIVFKDGSRNKVEDFFTENAFDGLIGSAQSLVETYSSVFGYFFEEE